MFIDYPVSDILFVQNFFKLVLAQYVDYPFIIIPPDAYCDTSYTNPNATIIRKY